MGITYEPWWTEFTPWNALLKTTDLFSLFILFLCLKLKFSQYFLDISFEGIIKKNENHPSKHKNAVIISIRQQPVWLPGLVVFWQPPLQNQLQHIVRLTNIQLQK